MSEHIGVPDGFTPVVGWRAWTLTVYDHTDNIYLKGQQSYWNDDGPTHAFCAGVPRSASASLPDGRNFITVPNPNYAIEMRRWMGAHGSCAPSEYDPVTGAQFLKAGPVTIALTRAVEAGPTQVPSSNCTCGLYVASSLGEARKYLRPVTDYSSEFGVIGRAALWGMVVEHETGARGEYGYPQAFYVPDKLFDRAAPKLKAKFKVPVFRMSELPDAPKDEAALAGGGVVAIPIIYSPKRHWHLRSGVALWCAVALNIAAAAWNIVGALLRHA